VSFVLHDVFPPPDLVYFHLLRKPPELVLERDKGSLVLHDVFRRWKWGEWECNILCPS